jgi:SAM-dependent methyltransferase
MRLCPACAFAHADSGWLCKNCGLAPPTADGITLLAPEIAGGDGSDATYEHEALAAAERVHFWFRARARLIAWSINRHFPQAASLLDVGCGSGGVLAELQTYCPQLTLTGAEVLLAALRYARARIPDVELLQVDVRRLPFEREFDVFCAFDVLEHLDDDERMLGEMAKAVRPGGGLVVTVPQHPQLWSRVDDYSRHRRRYRRSELVARVQRAGFAVQRVTSFVALMLPAMMLSRIRDRRQERPFDPRAELHIGAVANAIATLLSDVERYAIQLGVSWPAGGSLLLVAVKR